MDRKQTGAIGILAAIGTIIGVFGTWATIHGLANFKGWDANRGKTAAIAAAVALVLLALASWQGWRWAAIVATIAGILSAAFCLWSLIDIGGFAGAAGGFVVERGWGVWLASVSSVVLVVACVLVTVSKPAEAAPATQA